MTLELAWHAVFKHVANGHRELERHKSFFKRALNGVLELVCRIFLHKHAIVGVHAASHVFKRVFNGNLELLCRTSLSKHVIVGRLERACRKSLFQTRI
jgi:hypothetical protein